MIHIRRVPLLVALASLPVVAGCTQEKVWSKPGASSQDLAMTRYHCLREAEGVDGPDYVLAEMCIEAHGWKLIPKTE